MIIVAILIISIPLIYNGNGNFGGSDDKASQVIEQTGYIPWVSSLWTPPSEIETLLFALQAAIGALIIGYFLGYYTGKRKTQQ